MDTGTVIGIAGAAVGAIGLFTTFVRGKSKDSGDLAGQIGTMQARIDANSDKISGVEALSNEKSANNKKEIARVERSIHHTADDIKSQMDTRFVGVAKTVDEVKEHVNNQIAGVEKQLVREVAGVKKSIDGLNARLDRWFDKQSGNN